MEVMWSMQTATVREVMEAVNEGAAKPRAYTTVMTIMDRLHGKGSSTAGAIATPSSTGRG